MPVITACWLPTPGWAAGRGGLYRELGFSTSRTGDFMNLCRKLKNLPKVKARVETGTLEYTKAPVAAAPAVVPVRVSLEMTPTQFARYESLWEQIRKQGCVPADKVEALLAVMAGFGNESATRVDVRPPAQIHIHQCPDCEKATVQTSLELIEQQPAMFA